MRVAVLLLALSIVSCASKRSALVEDDRYRSFCSRRCAVRGCRFCVERGYAGQPPRRGKGGRRGETQRRGGRSCLGGVLTCVPKLREIVVVDAQTGHEVQNVSVPSLDCRRRGTVVFEPTSGAGIHHVYYLPYKYRRGSGDARYGDPWNDYLPAEYNADSRWATALQENLPEAEVLRFESRTKFDAFTPMGLIATAGETEKMLEACKERFMIFPEDRVFPISLAGNLPVRWVKSRPSKIFKGSALKNEYLCLANRCLGGTR